MGLGRDQDFDDGGRASTLGLKPIFDGTAQGAPQLLDAEARLRAEDIAQHGKTVIALAESSGFNLANILGGGVIRTGVTESIRLAVAQEEKDKARTSERLFLLQMTADQAAAYGRYAGTRAESYEEALRAEHGEEFVVGAAEEILTPDQLARLPGETDDAYEQRIRKLLEEEIFDEDGNVKPEYAHLDIAQWLYWQKEQEAAQMTANALEDGVITPEEQAEIDRVQRTGSANEAHIMRRAMKDGGLSADSAAMQASGEALKERDDTLWNDAREDTLTADFETAAIGLEPDVAEDELSPEETGSTPSVPAAFNFEA